MTNKSSRDFEDVELGRCERCGDVLPLEEMRSVRSVDDHWFIESEYLCDHCWDFRVITCTECEEESMDFVTTQDGNAVCRPCFRANFRDCVYCGDIYRADDDSWQDYCPTCEDYVFECCECGEHVHEDYGRETQDGDRVCENCYDSYYYDDDDEYGSSPIRNYSFRPRVKFFGEARKGRYFGIELECEVVNESVNSQAHATLDLFQDGYVVLKDDGTISEGFEIVSQPTSLDTVKRFWEPFFQNTPKGLRSYNTSTCGMHVHVSRTGITSLQIGKMLHFLHKKEHHTFIKKIAQRSSDSWGCFTTPKKISDGGKTNSRRYEALNLQNHRTIEFRLFKGTLAEDSFYKNVQFCDALVSFTATAVTGMNDLTIENFIAFVRKDKKQWTELLAFIDAKWLS